MELLLASIRPHRTLSPLQNKNRAPVITPSQFRTVGHSSPGIKAESEKMWHIPGVESGCPQTERGREGGGNKTIPEFTGEQIVL